MSNDIINATLLFGISSVDTDLASCLEIEHGKQNILKTINNYLELLDKAKDTLSLLRDSLTDDELNKIKLVSSIDGECLEIEGDEQIIDRFVAFGIAEKNDEESVTDITNDSDDTDDSEESDSGNTDGSNDSETSKSGNTDSTGDSEESKDDSSNNDTTNDSDDNSDEDSSSESDSD